jgi:uncharacterized protein
MHQRWSALTFLHWPLEPADVARLLPPGLEVDTFDGAAWVGLVPFRMWVRLPWLPPIPGASAFPETNVRTYVRGPDGGTGIWFLTLEAGRLAPVLTARAGLRLPYRLAEMSVEEGAGEVRYRSRRRWPDAPATTRIAVRPGEAIPRAEVSQLEEFLTARFRLYTEAWGRLLRVPADHAPWQLRRAEVGRLDQDLVHADGLPPVDGEPLVHYSDGVEVRIGAPAVVGLTP